MARCFINTTIITLAVALLFSVDMTAVAGDGPTHAAAATRVHAARLASLEQRIVLDGAGIVMQPKSGTPLDSLQRALRRPEDAPARGVLHSRKTKKWYVVPDEDAAAGQVEVGEGVHRIEFSVRSSEFGESTLSPEP